jgi:release factor H-coupled RctB family protein
MGSCVQNLSQGVTLIASEKTWIEGDAIQQLKKTSTLPGMQAVAGMPDLHPGRGYPIGAAFFSIGRVYPALVGSDIGCGMSLWQSNQKINKVNLDKLVRRLDDIEMPLDDSWQEYIQKRRSDLSVDTTNFDRSLGTIGGGNHFAEFQTIDEIYSKQCVDELKLDKKCVLLLAHSGSRGLGESILRNHVQQFSHDGLDITKPEFEVYIESHDHAVRWAELNRELIALRFLEALKAKGECALNVNHNLVTPISVNQKQGWLHRKGATPSDHGYVVIPGSRGDYSYIVKPKPSETGLYSLAHGAGRKWKRGDCQARLSHKYKREDLYRTELGSRVICGNKELLYDEAPQAYKPSQTIIDDLQEAGLLEVVARLKPLLTFKTHGSCSS